MQWQSTLKATHSTHVPNSDGAESKENVLGADTKHWLSKTQQQDSWPSLFLMNPCMHM